MSSLLRFFQDQLESVSFVRAPSEAKPSLPWADIIMQVITRLGRKGHSVIQDTDPKQQGGSNYFM